jgi:hypothetical protein
LYSNRVTSGRAVQESVEVASPEEFEAMRPGVIADMQEHLGDFVAKHMPKATFDEILEDAPKLNQLSQNLHRRSDKLKGLAGDTAENLQTTLVRGPLRPPSTHRPRTCMRCTLYASIRELLARIDTISSTETHHAILVKYRAERMGLVLRQNSARLV